MVRRRDTVCRRPLAVADLVAATAVLTLGTVVLGGDRVTVALVAVIPLVVLVSKVIGLYDRDEHW